MTEAAAPPPLPSLYRDCSLDDLGDEALWQKICPFLTCSVEPFSSRGGGSTIRPALAASAAGQLQTRGYFSIDAAHFDFVERQTHLVALLARGVMELMRHGFPPLFVLLYDEAWELTRIVEQFIPGTCGGHSHVGDFFVFAVLNAEEQQAMGVDAYIATYRPSGPHRDRPTAGPASFDAKVPAYVSIWLALSDATTNNSCLYVVPLAQDAGYYLAGDGDQNGNVPLRIDACIAQPLKQGGMLCFSHRLLHWGSALEQWALEEEDREKAPNASLPRIAFTTAFSKNSFEAPYFCHERFPLDGTTPLALRLGLVAGQSIQYEHLNKLTKHQLALTRRIFHAQKSVLAECYYEKISNACQMLTFLKQRERR